MSAAAISRRARLAGGLAALGLRLQAATWRRRSEGLGAFEETLAAGARALVIFWHGKYVPLFALLRGHRAAVFCSLSRRGRVIAEIARRFGYEPLLLPDHGGERSLRRMRRALARLPAAGLAVDGPLGPPHVVKRGAVELASDFGARVFPASVAMRRKRVLAGRWDRLEIPRLWSRVALVVGEPLAVPRGLDAAATAVWRERLGAALERCDRRAEELLSGSRSAERSAVAAGSSGPRPAPREGDGDARPR